MEGGGGVGRKQKWREGTKNNSHSEAGGQEIGRETKLHEQAYTMVDFRADYKSHCESSMAVLLFKNKHRI